MSDRYREAFRGFRARVEAEPDRLARMEIVADMLLEAALITVEGEGHVAMNREIRAFANSIKAAIPLARLYRAEQLIRDDATPAKPESRAGGGTMRSRTGGGKRKPLRG